MVEEDVSSRAVPLQLIPHLARSELQPFLPSCLFLRACDVAPVVLRDPIPEAASAAANASSFCRSVELALEMVWATTMVEGGKASQGRRAREGGPKEGGREAAASAKSKDYVHHHRERTAAEAHTASRARSLAHSLAVPLCWATRGGDGGGGNQAE